MHHSRHFLSYDVSVIVANALVSSRLDFAILCFTVCPPKNITRLQNIQNCLAHFVSGASRFSHVTPTLKSLHCFLLNNESSSKPWYSYISTLPLASQNTLPRISLYIHISTSVSHMMLQNSRMICCWNLPLHYDVSKGNLKLQKSFPL